VGDIRVTFETMPCDSATVMGRQMGPSFEGWEPAFSPCFEKVQTDAKFDAEHQRLIAEEEEGTIRHEHILLISRGTFSAALLLENREKASRFVTWAFRLIGFIMMCGGLNAIFAPIIVLLKVVPFIANIAAGGVFAVAFLSSILLTLVIVSLAWFLARPLLVTLAVAIGVGVFVLVSEVH